MMDRRSFLAGSVALLAAPLIGEAQQSETLPRVGVLSPLAAAPASINIQAFRDGLRLLGWIDGQNVNLDVRYAGGNLDRIADLADDLARLHARVIVVGGTNPAQSAHKRTSTVPLVFIGASDPVSAGLVASLPRPGGNATGLATAHEDVAGKYLELIREIVPRGTKFTVLFNPANTFNVRYVGEVRVVGRRLGVTLESVGAENSEALDSAIARLAAMRPDAVVIPTDTFLNAQRLRVVDGLNRLRLPAIFGFREFVNVGGLMSYGVSIPAMYRQAASYVDKILKGAKPGDLPVEQPTKFELVINLKTAKALGLPIPPSLLLRADEVIE